MAKTTRKPVFTAQMPSTPCTPQMRAELYRIAERDNLSLAELQRRAYDIFLLRDCSKSTEISSIAKVT